MEEERTVVDWSDQGIDTRYSRVVSNFVGWLFGDRLKATMGANPLPHPRDAGEVAPDNSAATGTEGQEGE